MASFTNIKKVGQSGGKVEKNERESWLVVRELPLIQEEIRKRATSRVGN